MKLIALSTIGFIAILLSAAAMTLAQSGFIPEGVMSWLFSLIFINIFGCILRGKDIG